MRLRHDEIKGMLPEYLKGTLFPEITDYVEIHLKECDDCREELGLLGEVFKVEAPDPGELFWKTLPQKVRTAAPVEKHTGFSLGLLFRPLAAVPVLAILVFTALIFYHKNKQVEYDPLFKDPLSYSALDYSGLKEHDIPPIMLELPEEGRSRGTEDYMEYGYQKEVAYLDAGEMERLLHVLESERKSGG